MEYAKMKFRGVNRKFGNEPHFAHIERTVKILRELPRIRDFILAAAYLHDIIEETDVSYEDLLDHFPVRVANIVKELTNTKEKILKMGKIPYLRYKANKLSDCALIIKLAHRLDNLTFIEGVPNEFLRNYCNETSAIIEGIRRKLPKKHKLLIKRIKKKINEDLEKSG